MPSSEPYEIPFTGVRLRVDSIKSYDELVNALFADIGAKPIPIDDFSKITDDWKSYERQVESHVGESGFILFTVFDHGRWIKKAGVDRKALRVILGNPLIAITMMRHDVSAGSICSGGTSCPRRGGQRQQHHLRQAVVIDGRRTRSAAARGRTRARSKAGRARREGSGDTMIGVGRDGCHLRFRRSLSARRHWLSVTRCEPRTRVR